MIGRLFMPCFLKTFALMLVSLGLAPMSFAQGALSNGGFHDGEISVVGEEDSWTFEAEQGAGLIRIQAFQVGGDVRGEPAFEPHIRIFAPGSAVPIAEDADSYRCFLLFSAPVTGTYTVKVSDTASNQNGTGNYRLIMYDPAKPYVVPEGDQGGWMASDNDYDGDITSGDIDIYSFHLDALDTVHFRAIETAGGGFSPELMLFDPSGKYVANGKGSYHASFSFQAKVAGEYKVAISTPLGSVVGAGAYRIRHTRIKAGAAVSGGEVVSGGRYDGTIAPCGMELYKIEMEAGRTLHLKVANLTGGTFTPQVLLFSPDGELLGDHSHADSAGLRIQAKIGGAHHVLVTGLNSSRLESGDCRLHVTATDPSTIVSTGDEGGSMTSGVHCDGAIELGDADLYAFQLEDTETVTFQVADTGTTGFSPEIWFYAPDGSWLANYTGADVARLSHQAKYAGTYYLVVQASDHSGSNVGNYRLHCASTMGPHITPAGDEGGVVQSGGVYSGTIDQAEMDIYTIDAQKGDLVYLRLAETGGAVFTPSVGVYGPDGVSIGGTNGDGVSDGDCRVETTGVQTLIVSDSTYDRLGAGTYSLSVVHARAPHIIPVGDEGGVITSGVPVTGSISLGEVDIFTFEAYIDDEVQVSVVSTSGAGFTPQATTYDYGGYTQANGTVYASSRAGVFTVVVGAPDSDFSQTGDYELSLTVTPSGAAPPAAASLGTLQSGSEVSGDITLTELDVWEIAATEGDTIIAHVVESVAGADYVPSLAIYTPDGGLLDLGTSLSGQSLKICWARAEQTGTYKVVVGSSGGFSSGDYTLNAMLSSGSFVVPDGDEGGAMTNGEIHSANLGRGEMDLWSFTAQAGDPVHVLIDLAPDAAVADLCVYSPSGKLIASGDTNDGFGGTDSERLSFDAPEGGTYLVMVKERLAYASGAYSILYSNALADQVVPSGDQGGPLISGLVHQGSLTGADADVWHFDAVAGEHFFVDVEDLTEDYYFSPKIIVYAPDGSRVDTGDTQLGDEASLIANQTGNYKVVVYEASAGHAGNYQVHFAKVPGAQGLSAGDEGGLIENGETRNGLIRDGEIDVWEFDAEEGTRIWAQLYDDSPGTSFQSQLLIYSPEGRLFGKGEGVSNAVISFRAQSTGTYRMVVREVDGDGEAGYTVSLACAGKPFLTSTGDQGGGFEASETKAGALAAGDMDHWAFHAMQGESINLELNNLSGSGYAFMIVYAPDGTPMAFGDDSDTATLSFMASMTGTYTLVVRERGGGGISNYELSGTGMTAAPMEVATSKNASGNLIIQWPSPSSGWALQESSTLGSASWGGSDEEVVDDGFHKRVTIDTNSGGKRFFRLQKP